MTLFWHKDDPPFCPMSWQAYTGKLCVGFVLCPSVNNPEKKWTWMITCLSGRRFQGKTKSCRDSKRALEKRWTQWLADAGLQPMPNVVVQPNA